ncbi:MAG: hypothetical protein PHO91_03510 [Patescibacteria group bacterium]|nr:hypothetical protein [Patescibacteria group bacterium]
MMIKQLLVILMAVMLIASPLMVTPATSYVPLACEEYIYFGGPSHDSGVDCLNQLVSMYDNGINWG